MLFNSLEFLAFFPAAVLICNLLPARCRVYWLLAASYFFYMCWNPVCVVLLLAVTAVTYGAALALVHPPKRLPLPRLAAWKKAVITLCLVLALGALAFFKYAAFLVNALNGLLTRLHAQPMDAGMSILLPVGISFYTFQALGYVLDVYRGKIQPEYNFFKYALFVSFFPQLASGPIGRAGPLLGQINDLPRQKRPGYRQVTNGLIVMLYGFFLKMVIADRAAVLVDTVFDAHRMYGSVEHILAALAFSLQIYCDFAGYSTIAVGAAQVMGFTLTENFDAPYFASSIRDFWRRWHISLTSWFRDYLYIPLGGNRCSKPRKYLNILITFLLSGLWHGADWHYVAWGGIHGAYQVVGDATKSWRERTLKKLNVNTACFSHKLLRVLITFCLTTVAWIFFRAGDIRTALSYCLRMITEYNPWVLWSGDLYQLGLNLYELNILAAAVGALFLTDLLRYRKGLRLDGFLERQNLWFKWLVILVLFLCVFVFGRYGAEFDAQRFLYIQF